MKYEFDDLRLSMWERRERNKPREPIEHEDPMGPARGIIIGVALSALICAIAWITWQFIKELSK